LPEREPPVLVPKPVLASPARTAGKFTRTESARPLSCEEKNKKKNVIPTELKPRAKPAGRKFRQEKIGLFIGVAGKMSKPATTVSHIHIIF
jgi:hypothetical protein